jgi:hypothetical protein
MPEQKTSLPGPRVTPNVSETPAGAMNFRTKDPSVIRSKTVLLPGSTMSTVLVTAL